MQMGLIIFIHTNASSYSLPAVPALVRNGSNGIARLILIYPIKYFTNSMSYLKNVQPC